MRICKVHICNIHSLSGEHVLEFSKPPFEGAGLFVIAGPTGSGKSTILDAITLALYGRIARHDGNFTEVVSHGADSAFAEVIFEMNGRKVLARWEITRKTRGANKGQLNAATRTVSVYDELTHEWQVVADKIREADKVIEELLGLSYDQFTRTVFLPQGAFTNFLKASGRERAQILEGLTGTEIYGELSKFCFELAREKKGAVVQERARLEGLAILSEEEVAEIGKKLDELKKEVETTTQRIGALDARLRLASDYEKAKNEQHLLEKEIEKAEKDREADAAKLNELQAQLAEARSRLDAHLKLKEELGPRWDEMQRMDESIKIQQNKVKELERQLGDSRSKKARLAEEISLLEKKIACLKQERKDIRAWLDQRPWLKPLERQMSAIEADWKRIQTLQQQIAELEATADRQEAELERQTAEAARLEARQQALEEKGNRLRTQIEAAAGRPEKLSDALDQLHQRQIALQNAIHTLDKAIGRRKELGKNAQAVAELEKSLATNQQALETAEKDLSRLEAKLPGLDADLAEAERRKELELLAQEFSAHRAKLKEGEACPLCGSTHHPALTKPVEAKVGEAERRLAKLKAERDALTEEISTRRARMDALKEKAEELAGQLRQAREQAAALRAEIDRFAQSLPEVRPEEEWEAWLEALQAEHDELKEKESKLKALWQDWQNWEKEMAKATDELKEARQKIRELESDRNRTRGQIREKAEEKAKLRAGIETQLKEAGLEAPLSPALLSELNTDLKKLEQQEQKRQQVAEELASKKGEREQKQQQLRSLQDEISNSEKILEKEKSILEKLSRERREKFGESQVDEERKAWETEEQRLREELESSQERCSELKDRLEKQGGIIQEKTKQKEALARKVEELWQQLLPFLGEAQDLAKAMAEWEEAKSTLTKTRDERLEEKGRYEQQLATHRQNERDAAALREKLEALEREAARWQALADLIGSAEGQKFRTQAQALTLRQLIGHANRQLARLLQGRYRLHNEVNTKKNTVGLDLYIVDQFQADTMRPVSSLSGGESFLVSLALALGLSEMAGGKIRVDSLFIDEGFGTLDDKNLDTAMEVLEDLRSSGRLVGIISHVKELKERIPVQVQVVPQGSGFSKIEVSERRLPGAP